MIEIKFLKRNSFCNEFDLGGKYVFRVTYFPEIFHLQCCLYNNILLNCVILFVDVLLEFVLVGLEFLQWRNIMGEWKGGRCSLRLVLNDCLGISLHFLIRVNPYLETYSQIESLNLNLGFLRWFLSKPPTQLILKFKKFSSKSVVWKNSN